MTARSQQRTFARNRMALDKSMPKKIAPALITEIVSESADTIRLTFNAQVTPAQLPAYTAGANGEQTVDNMMRVSATIIELTFTGEVQGTELVVKEGDPGIRTPAGGFVPAGSYAIPTFP